MKPQPLPDIDYYLPTMLARIKIHTHHLGVIEKK